MSTWQQGSRVRGAAEWLFRSPRRLVAVAAALVALPLAAVVALSSVTPATPTTQAPNARKSCAGTVSGFSAEFFDTVRPGWLERVSPWVEPRARQQVASIDPGRVPTGPTRVTSVHDDTASCDAVVEVHAVEGVARVAVVAQRGGIGDAPDWVVVEWNADGQAGAQ